MYFSETNRPSRASAQDKGFKKTVAIYEELINDKTGKLELKKTGEEPFYQKIQEEKEEQLLETLINRYKVDLNNKKITQLSEEIVDLTTMPADLIETYSLAHKLEKQFNESTADIKNYFHDFAGYLKSFQNGNLRSDLEKISKLHQKEVKNEVNPGTTTSANPGTTTSAEKQNTFLGGMNNGQ